MAACSGAATSQAPRTKPYLKTFEAAFGTSLVLNSRMKYSSTELMVIRDTKAELHTRSTMAPEGNKHGEQEEVMCL